MLKCFPLCQRFFDFFLLTIPNYRRDLEVCGKATRSNREIYWIFCILSFYTHTHSHTRHDFENVKSDAFSSSGHLSKLMHEENLLFFERSALGLAKMMGVGGVWRGQPPGLWLPTTSLFGVLTTGWFQGLIQKMGAHRAHPEAISSFLAWTWQEPPP